MAEARTENFTRRELTLADYAKAISHPARISILTALAKKQDCICGDLVLDLPLAQSTVSQHLKALKEIGLIKGTVDGTKSRYCIDWTTFEKMQSLMSGWMDKLGHFKKENSC